MTKILCPTRGGEASYQAQDVAIALARERAKPLVFIYVVDTHFLDRGRWGVRLDVVEGEIARMGEFLLEMARERAAGQGVQAEIRVRHGNLEEELVAAIEEEKADMLVLGRPVGKESAFRLAALQALADRIRAKTGVEVHIVGEPTSPPER